MKIKIIAAAICVVLLFVVGCNSVETRETILENVSKIKKNSIQQTATTCEIIMNSGGSFVDVANAMESMHKTYQEKVFKYLKSVDTDVAREILAEMCQKGQLPKDYMSKLK